MRLNLGAVSLSRVGYDNIVAGVETRKRKAGRIK